MNMAGVGDDEHLEELLQSKGQDIVEDIEHDDFASGKHLREQGKENAVNKGID